MRTLDLSSLGKEKYIVHSGDQRESRERISSKQDSRKQPRVACTLSVQVHAPNEDLLLFTYATDLSNNGIYVRSNRPLAIGSKVNLYLKPQYLDETLQVEGIVVRTVEEGKDSRGMGVAFIETSHHDRQGIQQLLDRANAKTLLAVGDASTYRHYLKTKVHA